MYQSTFFTAVIFCPYTFCLTSTCENICTFASFSSLKGELDIQNWICALEGKLLGIALFLPILNLLFFLTELNSEEFSTITTFMESLSIDSPSEEREVKHSGSIIPEWVSSIFQPKHNRF
jgi:hypothetical protein